MTVSFAIVAYNEEKTLPRLLSDLAAQDYPHEKIEVLLVDSMSTDGTWALMERFAREHGDFLAVKLLKNEKKNIPSGHNVVLSHYTGEVLTRLDAHTSIPQDFIRRNVEVIQSGETISAGRVTSICAEDGALNQTLLMAENSVFGGSAAKFRRSRKREYVSTAAFAFYRREVYDKVGFYNEHLPRSEDNDMNCRVREAGFRICFDPSIQSLRYSRTSLRALVRQKYLNGYWIGKTMGVNPRCFSLFHFVPFVFVLAVLLTGALALGGQPLPAKLVWASYGAVAVGMSAAAAAQNENRSWYCLLLPFLFLLLHLSYGIGALVGLAEMPFWVRKIKD